jgi:membrane protease subunit (stomatin/prohibitin family)
MVAQEQAAAAAQEGKAGGSNGPHVEEVDVVSVCVECGMGCGGRGSTSYSVLKVCHRCS